MSDGESDRESEDDDREEEGRHYLLFNALFTLAPLGRIRSIVEEFPESVECDPEAEDIGGNKWCSALHRATSGAGLDVILYLATQNPEALKTRDRNGRLPLHLAVIHRAELPVVRALVDMYPDALREPVDDKTGHLPLHCALLNGYTGIHEGVLIDVERHSRPDVTAFLVRRYPAAVRVRTPNGHLPLHLAFAAADIGDDGLPAVGVADSDADSDDDDDFDPDDDDFDPDDDDFDPDDGDEYMRDGDVPYEATPLVVVKALLEAWPDSVRKTDPRGRLALHLACMNKVTSPDVIRRLQKAWPSSLVRRDVEKGYLPIHYATLSGTQIGVVSFLATKRPRSVSEPTDKGNLPLHLHLMSLGHRHGNQLDSIELVRLLVSHCPLSVRHMCGRWGGALALHLAVSYGASLDVVQFLVQTWHESLHVKNNYGWLSLHLAVRDSESLDLVRFLVEQCPPSVQMRTDDEWSTVLHIAAHYSRKLEIVQFVHQSWPDALREQSDDGCTPLHEATQGSFWGNRALVRLEIIRYFLDQLPGLVEETNRRGYLPLHFAAASHATPDVIRLLVERGPKYLLLARLHDDGEVALHMAVAHNVHHGAPLDVVETLVELCPKALQVADKRGFLPLHESVYVFCVRFDPPHLWDLRMPMIRHLVKAWPQALEVQDGAGRIPLLVAAESNATLDVLFHLLTSGPQSISGRRRGQSRAKHPQLS
jgi:ankyrin repeat protein